MSLNFSKHSFQQLELPDFLINIWSYSERPNDPFSIRYQQWCIEVAKERWRSQDLNFDYVINNLRKKNNKFCNFGQVLSADKNMIYTLIWNRP